MTPTRTEMRKQTMTSFRIMHTGLWLAALVVIVYDLFYLIEPLPEPWGENVTTWLTLLSSVAAAILGTLVFRQFQHDDPPRLTWTFFLLGLWTWASGEIVWLAIQPIYDSLPDVNITDFFWTMAFVFFAMSVVIQYRQINTYNFADPESSRRLKLVDLGVLALALGIASGVTLVIYSLMLRGGYGEDWEPLGMFLAILYPVLDLGIGLAALNLSRLFGQGIWGRAWWGLIAFAISDGITSWYYLGGSQYLSETSDLILSLFTDTLYIGAYIIVALACLSHLLLFRRGPEPTQDKYSGEA
ncbi:MAG: hypothetical protein AB1894_15100 [Chloroflexota bacterium]